MKILHYNCQAGISGDMNLAAMLDLGVDKNELVRELKKLNLDGWEIETFKDLRGGIFGTRVEVVCKEHEDSHHHEDHHEHHTHSHLHHEHHDAHEHLHHHSHRHYADIKDMIEKSSLSENVKKMSIDIFEKIARAEAKVHNKEIGDVCFHEVGAVDSIIDIVGAAICAEMLGVEKFTASKVELGGGTVRCAHGLMPVPAPATALLAQEFPSTLGACEYESTTPTGAAIIATLCSEFEPKLEGKILKSAVGVGHRDVKNLPNVLRVMLIEVDENSSQNKIEKMCEISSNIDDMPAEEISFLLDKLFEAGALDAWQENIFMKKNRLATKVCALVKSENLQDVKEAFFKHSSTIGLRQTEVLREALPREIVKIKTSLGDVACKVSTFKNLQKKKFEFEDLKKIANENSLSISEVLQKINDELSR